MPPKHLFLTTSIVGRSQLTNFEFDPDKPYTFCCICGALYQDEAQRKIMADSSVERIAHATLLRRTWAQNHAKTHTDREHAQLRLSGRAVTPEAAMRLVPYGISPLTDMVLSGEHEHAAKTAPRQPYDDAQTLLRPIHVGYSGTKDRY